MIYSPSQEMDKIIDSWLTSRTAWTGETLDSPDTITFSGTDPENAVDASGFQQNRFKFESTGKNGGNPLEDARHIVSDLTGDTGFLSSYCSWWIVRYHVCHHDEDGSCETWTVLDKSNSYTGQENVPLEVPQ